MQTLNGKTQVRTLRNGHWVKVIPINMLASHISKININNGQVREICHRLALNEDTVRHFMNTE